jgi:hypothetical protein
MIRLRAFSSDKAGSGWFFHTSSSEDGLNDLTMHIGKSEVAALEFVRESGMVETQAP